MDNNNKQNNYNPYGNLQNDGFDNNSQYNNSQYNNSQYNNSQYNNSQYNNSQYNQQYYRQNNLNQEQQNNDILNKDSYVDCYNNSTYNKEQYNQQYSNNAYGQNNSDNNTYNQNSYNSYYDNGQQYNSQMNYQYNKGVSENSPGYGYSIGSMVCGICGLVGCWCYGFLGVILGIIAIVLYFQSKKMDNGITNGMAKAGMVCGIISLVLGVIFVAYLIFIFAVLGSSISDPYFYSDFYSTAFLK